MRDKKSAHIVSAERELLLIYEVRLCLWCRRHKADAKVHDSFCLAQGDSRFGFIDLIFVGITRIRSVMGYVRAVPFKIMETIFERTTDYTKLQQIVGEFEAVSYMGEIGF